MLTVNRRPGHPIDRGINVIVDLPHAGDLPARPHLCSLTHADTHEPVTSVIGMSMHFDHDPARGDYELWVTAEQLIDDNGEPLKSGNLLAPAFHTEYFRGTLRTALFRYRVAGFTTGPAFDRKTGAHPHLGSATAVTKTDTKPAGLTEFEVTFSHPARSVAHVEARHFEYVGGFVVFYDAEGNQAASYRIDEVFGVRTVPGKRVLVVDEEQLAILRSAVLWEADRTAVAAASIGDYRQHVIDVLVDVLGMMPPPDHARGEHSAAANAAACCVPGEESCACEDADAVEPNERTRQGAARHHEIVERR